MVTYLSRSAWGARAAESGPGSLTVSRVIGAVIHWPGSASETPFSSQAAVASALRGWQAYHMDTKGWSDIAYQVAVDQAGRAWTLRGLRTQSGANGNNELNEEYGAILLVLIAGEQPSAAMKATVRGVIADFRKIYPKGTLIVPHSKVRPDGTDCPGDAARAAIARGDFTPGTTTPQEDEMTPAQMTELKNYIEERTQAYADFIVENRKQTTERDLDAIQAAVARVPAEVWNTLMTDVYTSAPDDKLAASWLLTLTAVRASDRVMEQLQPQFDEIKAALAALAPPPEDPAAALPKA